MQDPSLSLSFARRPSSSRCLQGRGAVLGSVISWFMTPRVHNLLFIAFYSMLITSITDYIHWNSIYINLSSGGLQYCLPEKIQFFCGLAVHPRSPCAIQEWGSQSPQVVGEPGRLGTLPSLADGRLSGIRIIFPYYVGLCMCIIIYIYI